MLRTGLGLGELLEFSYTYYNVFTVFKKSLQELENAE